MKAILTLVSVRTNNDHLTAVRLERQNLEPDLRMVMDMDSAATFRTYDVLTLLNAVEAQDSFFGFFTDFERFTFKLFV